jgi:DNA modification methylase
MTEPPISDTLKHLADENDLDVLKSELLQMQAHIFELAAESEGVFPFAVDQHPADNDLRYILSEIDQILKTKTIERAHYYIKRLIKSLTEVKSGKINDINLNRWKDYDDIITDSLWIINKRDRSGEHNAGYWGNFIPQIPNQLIRRYTREKEWVLDPFLGSGTTLIECKRLGRNGLGVELSESIAGIAREKVEKEKSVSDSICKIINADSTKVDLAEHLTSMGIESVQMIILHPPYWDIIKFSEDNADLSNAENIEEFLKMLTDVVDNTSPLLDDERYMALVIGDKYAGGEWIPLGFMAMQEILKRKFKLKSIIVKNFEETKGKMNTKELWRYRALLGGFYLFKHEYIFLFRKA